MVTKKKTPEEHIQEFRNLLLTGKFQEFDLKASRTKLVKASYYRNKERKVSFLYEYTNEQGVTKKVKEKIKWKNGKIKV